MLTSLCRLAVGRIHQIPLRSVAYDFRHVVAIGGMRYSVYKSMSSSSEADRAPAVRAAVASLQVVELRLLPQMTAASLLDREDLTILSESQLDALLRNPGSRRASAGPSQEGSSEVVLIRRSVLNRRFREGSVALPTTTSLLLAPTDSPLIEDDPALGSAAQPASVPNEHHMTLARSPGEAPSSSLPAVPTVPVSAVAASMGAASKAERAGSTLPPKLQYRSLSAREQQLFQAVQLGDLQAVMAGLTAGPVASANTLQAIPDKDFLWPGAANPTHGATPLHFAAFGNHLEVRPRCVRSCVYLCLYVRVCCRMYCAVPMCTNAFHLALVSFRSLQLCWFVEPP